MTIEPMTSGELETLDKIIRQVEDNIRHYEDVDKIIETDLEEQILPVLRDARAIMQGIRDSGCWVWTP